MNGIIRHSAVVIMILSGTFIAGCDSQNRSVIAVDQPAKSTSAASDAAIAASGAKATEAADRMAQFARFIGGEWRQTAASGTSMHHTWGWGPGRASIREIAAGEGAGGEPWHELNVYYWHPVRREIRLLGISPFDRGISEGRVNFDGEKGDGIVDLFQTAGQRQMGLRWVFDGENRYRDTLLEATSGGKFETLVEFEQTRSDLPKEPRRPTQADKPPEPSEYLKPLRSLLGDGPGFGQSWRAQGKWIGGEAIDVETTFEWLPYADVIMARTVSTTKEGEPLHLLDMYVYHHTGARKLRCLAVSYLGVPHEGDVKVLDDGGLEFDLEGFERTRVLPHFARIEFEKDGTVRYRIWSTEGKVREPLLDLRHQRVIPAASPESN